MVEWHWWIESEEEKKNDWLNDELWTRVRKRGERESRVETRGKENENMIERDIISSF